MNRIIHKSVLHNAAFHVFVHKYVVVLRCTVGSTGNDDRCTGYRRAKYSLRTIVFLAHYKSKTWIIGYSVCCSETLSQEGT